MVFGILEACHNVLDWKASEAEYEISVLVTGMFFSVAYFLYFLILLWRSTCLLVRCLPALFAGLSSILRHARAPRDQPDTAVNYFFAPSIARVVFCVLVSTSCVWWWSG